jgi:hypothetical protein
VDERADIGNPGGISMPTDSHITTQSPFQFNISQTRRELTLGNHSRSRLFTWTWAEGFDRRPFTPPNRPAVAPTLPPCTSPHRPAAAPTLRPFTPPHRPAVKLHFPLEIFHIKCYNNMLFYLEKQKGDLL